MKIKKKKQIAKKWFLELQKLICYNIEGLEKIYGSNKKFKKKKWKHGEFRIIEGEVIEKGGVVFSNVIGKASFIMPQSETQSKALFSLASSAIFLYMDVLRL